MAKYLPLFFPTLQTDTCQIEESSGGDADLLLLAGTGNADRDYFILGSVTGTKPGIPLPGGRAILPLNWDIFMNVVITFMNTPIFSNFRGTLDASGSAAARLDTLGPLPPGTAGTVIHVAYALNGPWDFTSNPVALEVVP